MTVLFKGLIVHGMILGCGPANPDMLGLLTRENFGRSEIFAS